MSEEIKEMKFSYAELQLQLIEANELILVLQQENKQLKEELQKADSITQSCIFNGKKESELNFRQSLNLVKELRQEKQQLKEKVEWYEKENKHNQEIIIKDTKVLDEIRKHCESKIKICDETYLNEEYNWDEDFILQILSRKNTYKEILDKVKE